MAAPKLTLRPGQVPLCPDCVNASEDDDMVKYLKFNQYFCTHKCYLVCEKYKCNNFVNKYLKPKRDREAPQVPVETSVLLKRLEELMLCDAFDHVSGTIKLHSAYSHVTDITINLGPTSHQPSRYVCSHCMKWVTLVADITDIDKFYCPDCLKHTEEGYDDEVPR